MREVSKVSKVSEVSPAEFRGRGISRGYLQSTLEATIDEARGEYYLSQAL